MDDKIQKHTVSPSGKMAALASATLAMEPTTGIPTWLVNIMDMGYQERVAGFPPGAYRHDPDAVHIAFLRESGGCFVDQYLATNPLTMEAHGYDSHLPRTATTGADSVTLDGVPIDSPEAVVAHIERHEIPRLEAARAMEVDEEQMAQSILDQELTLQRRLLPDILKVPYGDGFNQFPTLRYGQYGYENYLTAFLMYPEVMERDFRIQADLAVRQNRIAARAIAKGGRPKVIRLDHDVADSKGTLVNVRMLDDLWFPHFARAIQPYLDADIRLIWHCDGNLMDVIPRLLECGIGGFQGFQYENGMEYEQICRMKTRDNGPLMIWAGVSVSRILPFGTADEVRNELAWLVEHAPPVGLVLGTSSSVTPGVPWKNLDALLEGLRYYRERS